MDIAPLELLGQTLASVRYAPVLRGAALVRGADSAVTAYWLLANSSKRGDAADMLKIGSVVLHAADLPLNMPRWYAREFNHRADRGAAAQSIQDAAAAGVTHTITLPTTPEAIAAWLAAQVPFEDYTGAPFAPSPDWNRVRKPHVRWHPAAS
jgi:hypothetical protein